MEDILYELEEDFKFINSIDEEKYKKEKCRTNWETINSPLIKESLFRNDFEFFKIVHKNKLAIDTDNFGDFVRKKVKFEKPKDEIVKSLKKKIKGFKKMKRELEETIVNKKARKEKSSSS
jgi:hypothetical protein